MDNNTDARKAALDWNGLKKILRTARARNESVSLELTNWMVDNEKAALQTPAPEVVTVESMRDIVSRYRDKTGLFLSMTFPNGVIVVEEKTND